MLSGLAIILKRRRELVALLLLYNGCLVAVGILSLFLTVPWAGLQCVIVVFSDHTHLCLVGMGVHDLNLLKTYVSKYI